MEMEKYKVVRLGTVELSTGRNIKSGESIYRGLGKDIVYDLFQTSKLVLKVVARESTGYICEDGEEIKFVQEYDGKFVFTGKKIGSLSESELRKFSEEYRVGVVSVYLYKNI